MLTRENFTEERIRELQGKSKRDAYMIKVDRILDTLDTLN